MSIYQNIKNLSIQELNYSIFDNPNTINLLTTPNEHEDIMNGLFSVKNLPFNLVIYKNGGLYDKIAAVIKEHGNDVEMPNQDYYDWYQVPFSLKLAFQVCLMKPGFERIGIKTFHKNGDYLYKYCNFVKLNMKWYYSTTMKCNAVTFADTTNVIKPIKILDHSWEDYDPKPADELDELDEFIYRTMRRSTKICSNCGLLGEKIREYKNLNDSGEYIKNVIVPEKLLTCTENTINDILT